MWHASLGYDAQLLALTSRAFRLYALSFLIMGFNVYASSFFTALGDGVTSALISFLRTLVFQLAALLLLAGSVYGWRATARDGRTRWWLVLVSWVWACSHGTWVVGLAVGGLAVAEAIGGVRRPWTVANESGRIRMRTPVALAS